jgi:hypothetical protein
VSELWAASSCGRSWMKDKGAFWFSRICGATGCFGGCGCGCIKDVISIVGVDSIAPSQAE